MARIRVTRVHGLTLDRVRELAEDFARDIAEEFDIRYEWRNGVLEFRRSGAQGSLHIDDREVHIQMYLEMLLMPLRGRIQAALEEGLDELLEGEKGQKDQ